MFIVDCSQYYIFMDVTLHVYMFLGLTSGLTLVQERIGIPGPCSTAKIVYTNVCFMDVYVLVSFPTRKWQKMTFLEVKFSDVRGLQPRNPITWAVYWKPYHHRNGGLGLVTLSSVAFGF